MARRGAADPSARIGAVDPSARRGAANPSAGLPPEPVVESRYGCDGVPIDDTSTVTFFWTEREVF